jgi:hypothetical protein
MVPQIGSANDSRSDSVRLYVTKSVMVLSAPWCRQNRSRSQVRRSDLPTAQSSRHCPTLCHEVGAKPLHSFVGTMVPTKSKSDTDRPWSSDRICQWLKGQTLTDFMSQSRSTVLSAPWCRQNQSRSQVRRSDLPMARRSDTEPTMTLRSDLAMAQRSDTVNPMFVVC